MSLTEASGVYKPFHYPWAYEYWLAQQQVHWLPAEVPMGQDVKDWKTVITDGEKNLLTNLFKFFTQGDIEVNDCYMTKYAQVFKPTEVKMMLSAISNMETIHVDAYSHLLDTLDFPDSTYSEFLNVPEIKAKWDLLQEFNVDTPEDIAETLAVVGGFTEGLQLFATFAIMLNFPRHNKMKGMGQIITWSVRDETLHVEAMMKLYHTHLEENPQIDRDVLAVKVTEHLHTVISNEDDFIDLAFEQGSIEGLTANEVKSYIRYIGDMRMEQLGLPKQFFVDANPLPWLDTMLNADEHANFFEQRATEYTKSATTGTWNDIY